MQTNNNPTSPALIFGLAMVAGGGLTAMIVALGIGVIRGAEADSTVIGSVFIAGLLLLALGIGAWVGLVRPFDHFDDINVGTYTGHEGHGHEPTHTEELLLPEGVEAPAHDAHAAALPAGH